MILTAQQPVYLPWLGLFHKIALSDKFCFFDNIQYQVRDWNNRNKIKFANGQSGWITVPVHNRGHREKSYLDLEINNDIPWQRKHWKSIEMNYRNAPYFKFYENDLKKFYDKEWKFLVDLNFEMLLFFLEKLGIKVPVVRMKDFGFKGEKSDLVLDMCVQLGADVYIFGKLGKDYADRESFSKQQIKVLFQDYNHPEYQQLHGNFVSHLSIVDLLMNCGPESYSIIMSGNLQKKDIK